MLSKIGGLFLLFISRIHCFQPVKTQNSLYKHKYYASMVTNEKDFLNDKNSINANTAIQSCQNSIWLSILKLSRNTGVLTIANADVKKEKIYKDLSFNCKKVTKKIF